MIAKIQKKDYKVRNLSYDLMRIIAIFAVILIHVSAESYYKPEINKEWILNGFINSLVHSWAVPLFVTISGALLLGKKRFNNWNNYKKYILRILICLIAWQFIYYFYSTPNFTINNIILCFKEIIIGQVYSHLWYLYLIIGLYVLMPIFDKLIISLTKKELQYLILILFITTIFLPSLEMYTNIKFTKLINSYEVLNFSPYIFYFILGYYVNKYILLSKCNAIILLIFSVVLILLNAVVGCIISIRTNSKVLYTSSSSIVAFLMDSSIFCICKSYYANKSNKIISKLGQLTFGVYLVHFLIEKILLRFNFQANLFNPILGNIIVAITILIFSYIFSWIISKIPYFKKIIGL